MTTTTPAEIPVEATMDRRSVLKGFGIGGVTLIAGGAGAVTYRSTENGVLDAGSGTPYEPWKHWRDDPSPLGAVAAAILAASPHNTQPWLFHVTADGIDVFGDSTRTLPSTDPLRREHEVGVGCALENLVLALGARGYEAAVATSPDPASSQHLARVTLTRTAAVTSPLYEAIGSRHSNRGPYTAEPVSAQNLGELSAQATGLPGVEMRWFDSTATKAAIGSLLIEAARAVIHDRAQSQEGHAWFRNDRDDIDRHRDGLTLDGQGLGRFTLAAAKILPAGDRVAGDEFWLKQTRTVHTATAAAYGMVMVDDPDDVRLRLAGGRLLQRVHLSATATGLALQHLNQITERVDRERSQGLPASFAPRLRSIAGSGQVLALVRIGHPEHNARPSPRRNPAAVVV